MPTWVDKLLNSQFVQLGLAALAFLIALWLVIVIARMLMGGRLRLSGGRTRQARLGIVDAFDLDRQRQLIIVRRDNTEHLIMIGGPNDLVIESEILRVEAREARDGRRDKSFDFGGDARAPSIAARDTAALGNGAAPVPRQEEPLLPMALPPVATQPAPPSAPPIQPPRAPVEPLSAAPALETGVPRAPTFPLPPRRPLSPERRVPAERPMREEPAFAPAGQDAPRIQPEPPMPPPFAVQAPQPAPPAQPPQAPAAFPAVAGDVAGRPAAPPRPAPFSRPLPRVPPRPLKRATPQPEPEGDNLSPAPPPAAPRPSRVEAAPPAPPAAPDLSQGSGLESLEEEMAKLLGR